MAAKKTTRVSPSKRGEGSKPKPVAKKVSPSKRGEGSSNTKGIVAMKKKTAKVQESAVGNIPMTVVRAAKVIADYASKGPKLPSTKPKVSSDPMRNKNAPKKTNDQLFDEYYKGRKQAPPRG